MGKVMILSFSEEETCQKMLQIIKIEQNQSKSKLDQIAISVNNKKQKK